MTERDLRIDFLRGMALLVVLIDHIEWRAGVEYLSQWTLASNGLSDAAEGFVFLSGLVFGQTSSRSLDKYGFRSAQLKALFRAGAIYLTFLLTTFASILIAICCQNVAPELAAEMRLNEGVFKWILLSLPMIYQLYGLDILAFYALVVPLGPIMLLGCRNRPWLAWSICLSVYLLTQNVPWLRLPSLPIPRDWYFNPFAWQLLFFFGIYVGSARRPWNPSQTLRSVMLIVSLNLLVAGVVFQWAPDIILGGSTRLHDWIDWPFSWTAKTSLGPLRLIHFGALSMIVWLLLPSRDAALWRSMAAASFVTCGQHSLMVYALGTTLMFLTSPIFHLTGISPTSVVMTSLDCWLLCFMTSHFWGLRVSRQRNARTSMMLEIQ